MFLRSVFRTVPFHIFLLVHFVSIVFVSGHLEFTPVDLWIFVGRPHALTGSQDENSRSSNRIFRKNVSLRIGPNVFDGKIGQGVVLDLVCPITSTYCNRFGSARSSDSSSFDLGASWCQTTKSPIVVKKPCFDVLTSCATSSWTCEPLSCPLSVRQDHAVECD